MNNDGKTRFFTRELLKPDGRKLFLFSRRELKPDWDLSHTLTRATASYSHLRWNPLRGEWVAYASHRQSRTFLPPKEYNPLAPMVSNEIPTELPAGDYEIAVFENLFPSLDLGATEAPHLFVPTAPGTGSCEVVVFTQDSDASLSSLTLDRVELIFQVLGERYKHLAENPKIKYILPFENRGVEVGVTLHHPHSQIYAYPFVPPYAHQMAQTQNAYFQKHGKGLLSFMLENEIRDEQRLVHQEKSVSAFIPVCARYPYEVWIVPHREVRSVADLDSNELKDLTRTLKTVLLKYDGLWDKKFPYLMSVFNAPTDATEYPNWHFHIQFFPPLRTKERLKYLAGTELGAGMFVNDSIPEDKAQELRAVKVQLNE